MFINRFQAWVIILATVIDEIKESYTSMVALQLDESTSVASCSQLQKLFTSYNKNDHVKEECLFCELLSNTTRGEDVFQTLKKIIEKRNRSKLIGVYTDGEPSMIGIRSEFQALVKKVTPQILPYRCLIR